MKLSRENYEYLLAREHQQRVLKEQRGYLVSRKIVRTTVAVAAPRLSPDLEAPQTANLCL